MTLSAEKIIGYFSNQEALPEEFKILVIAFAVPSVFLGV